MKNEYKPPTLEQLHGIDGKPVWPPAERGSLGRTGKEGFR